MSLFCGHFSARDLEMVAVDLRQSSSRGGQYQCIRECDYIAGRVLRPSVYFCYLELQPADIGDVASHARNLHSVS